MEWKDFSAWMKGLTIGSIVALILSFTNRFLFQISWDYAPLGFINLIFGGFSSQASLSIIVFNWILIPCIFTLIWVYRDKKA